MKRLRKMWCKVRSFFTQERFESAVERHRKAADGLDAAVREMLKK